MSEAGNSIADNEEQQFDRTSISRRIISALVGAAYAALLIQTYIVLGRLWGYLGFWYSDPGFPTTALSVAGAAVLMGSLPTNNWTIVGFTKWVLCLTMFIPLLVLPPQQGAIIESSLTELEVLVFCSGMTFILLLPNGKPFPAIYVDQRLLTQLVSGVWIAGSLLIAVVFRDSLNVVGLDQVYEQRSSAGSLAAGAMGYLLGTLSGAINPFLLIVGLKDRKPIFVGMALFGQILIYATLAAKVVIGSTLLCIAVYFLFSQDRIGWKRVYLGILGLAIAGPLITRMQNLAGEGLPSTISDLIYLRILTLPGMLTGIYADFFDKYPVTYLSHSLIGRLFTTYPYGNLSVGQVIGYYVFPDAGASVVNYNANYIAADGITGFGLIGIPIIVLASMIVFWLMSKLVGRDERALTCATLTPFIVSLADSSIFTALLTSGGALAMVLLYLRRGRTKRSN